MTGTTTDFKPGDRVTAASQPGVAWTIDHRPLVWVADTTLITVDDNGDYDPDGEELEVPTDEGEWVTDAESTEWHMHMVGDDRDFVHDESDLTLLDEDDYCHVCGQTGCTHDGRERSTT